MKQLSETQLQENWDKLIQVIKDTFEDGSERRRKSSTKCTMTLRTG